jgi:dTDP-4-dehydrorhamnose 3,5-epimerase
MGFLRENMSYIEQLYLSKINPNVTKAWHRHTRGQVDYIIPVTGRVAILLKDEEGKNVTSIAVDAERRFDLIRVPGHYWHGVQNFGKTPAIVLYALTELYDYENPDEERAPFSEDEQTDRSGDGERASGLENSGRSPFKILKERVS